VLILPCLGIRCGSYLKYGSEVRFQEEIIWIGGRTATFFQIGFRIF